jgi:hypothetical protein
MKRYLLSILPLVALGLGAYAIYNYLFSCFGLIWVHAKTGVPAPL